MQKNVKNHFLCVLASGVITLGAGGAALVITANSENETKTVNYVLNGGFRLFGGNSEANDTFDPNDFSVATTDDTMLLNAEFKKKYLGNGGENNTQGTLIFKLADESMRGKQYSNLLGSGTAVTVNTDGTWAMPRGDYYVYPSDMLKGFVLDENKNGEIDENETLYSWGDSIPVTDGMSLICAYETDYLYGTTTSSSFESYRLMGLKYINRTRPNTQIGDADLWTEKYGEMIVENVGLMQLDAIFPYSGAVADNLSSNFIDGTNNYTRYFYSENQGLERNTFKAFKNVEIISLSKLNRISTGNGQNLSTNQLVQLAPSGGEITIAMGDEIYELGSQTFDFSANTNSTVKKARIILPGFSSRAGGAKRVLSYFAKNQSEGGNGYLAFNGDTVSNGTSDKYLFGIQSAYDTQSDMNLVVYVKKGTTESVYPTKGCGWYNETYTMKTAAGHNVPMRECVAVNFNLDGGKIGGKTFFPASYFDVGAVSVKDSDGKEYNLCEEKNNANGLSYNPAAANTEYLKAYKPSDPVRSGYSFVGWKDSTGYIWTEEDWENGGFVPYGENGDFTLTAEWKKINEGNVTINLGEGFRISQSGAISTDGFSLKLNAGETYTLDHATVRKLFTVGGEKQYVYGKGSATVAYHHSDIKTAYVTAAEDGTYTPEAGKTIPGGVLFGLFNDENGNGVLDDSETLYRTGDSFVAQDGMNLVCWYNTNMYFAPVSASELHTKYELIDGAKSIPEVNTNLSTQDLQPLYAQTVSIGTAAFRETRKFLSVELPETVQEIKGNAFRDANTVDFSGFENVAILRQWAAMRIYKNEAGYTQNVVLSKNLIGMEREALKFDRGDTTFNIVFTNDAAALGYDGETKTYLVFDGYGQTSPLWNQKQYVYVPYGQTKNYYPTIDTFKASFNSQTIKSGNNNIGTDEKFMTDSSGDYLKLREYHAISFDLGGGNVNGKPAIADTYMDARAVSVQTKNQAGTVQEVNLRNAGEVLKSGVTVNEAYRLANTAGQNLSMLKAEKPADPVKKGYTFVGWQDQFGNVWMESEWAQGGKTDVEYNGKVELRALWTTSEYSITYELNGGTNAAGNPATFTVGDTIVLEDAVREGYEFKGWYTDALFTNKIEKILRGTAGDLTLYAKFVGTATVVIDGVSKEVETAGAYILPEYTKENGKGWIVNGKIYAAGAAVELPIGGSIEITSFTFSATVSDNLTAYVRESDATKSGITFRVNISFGGVDALPEGISISASVKNGKYAQEVPFVFGQSNIMQDEQGYYVLARIINVTNYRADELTFTANAKMTYEGETEAKEISVSAKSGITIKAIAQKIKALADYDSMSAEYKTIIEGWCEE